VRSRHEGDGKRREMERRRKKRENERGEAEVRREGRRAYRLG